MSPLDLNNNFIKTTYDISLDSQISFLPLGFSPTIYLLLLEHQESSEREKGINKIIIEPPKNSHHKFRGEMINKPMKVSDKKINSWRES